MIYSDQELMMMAAEDPEGLASELYHLRRAADEYLAASDPLPPNGIEARVVLMRACRGEVYR